MCGHLLARTYCGVSLGNLLGEKPKDIYGLSGQDYFGLMKNMNDLDNVRQWLFSVGIVCLYFVSIISNHVFTMIYFICILITIYKILVII